LAEGDLTKSIHLQILYAAHEIALGNTDLSQRTEEQTASSMEEITATIKQSSKWR